MFFNFGVHDQQRNFLRFIWCQDNAPAKPLIEYRMTVHVFGNAPSPAIATLGLRKSACVHDVIVAYFVRCWTSPMSNSFLFFHRWFFYRLRQTVGMHHTRPLWCDCTNPFGCKHCIWDEAAADISSGMDSSRAAVIGTSHVHRLRDAISGYMIGHTPQENKHFDSKCHV